LRVVRLRGGASLTGRSLKGRQDARPHNERPTIVVRASRPQDALLYWQTTSGSSLISGLLGRPLASQRRTGSVVIRERPERL
jgi:hypothetical protein